LAGLVTLMMLAVPIVLFGLTPAGQARLQTVVPLDRYRGLALVPYYLKNLASYSDPRFLFFGAEPTFHHRLDGYGPVLLVMLPLLLNVLYEIVRRPTRPLLLCLWWIVAAPASAALHRESPSSALLLGAIPSWHLLSGLGGALRLPDGEGWRHKLHLVVTTGLVALGLMTTVFVALNLYVQYPVYAADDWLFGSREIVEYLEAHRGADADVLVSDRLATPHVLVLFYAMIDPAAYQRAPIHVRQPNVRSRGEIGPYRFGRIEDLLKRPGRHLVWVTANEGSDLFGVTPPVYGVKGSDGRTAQLVYEIGRP
jgi:hypothetical protein